MALTMPVLVSLCISSIRLEPSSRQSKVYVLNTSAGDDRTKIHSSRLSASARHERRARVRCDRDAGNVHVFHGVEVCFRDVFRLSYSSREGFVLEHLLHALEHVPSHALLRLTEWSGS